MGKYIENNLNDYNKFRYTCKIEFYVTIKN